MQSIWPSSPKGKKSIAMILYANFIATYCISGIAGMFVIKTLPSIFRDSGMSAVQIGWFLHIVLLPWCLKILYTPYIQNYRKTPTKTQTLMVGANLGLIVLVALSVLLDYGSDFVMFCLLCFLIQVALSISDITLSATGIDTHITHYAYITAIRVIAAAIGAIFGSGMFLLLYGHYGTQVATSALVGMIAIFVLPSFFIHKLAFISSFEPASTSALTSTSVPLKSLKSTLKTALKENYHKIALILLANLGARLGMFMIGVFLVDQKISLETLGLVFGLYSTFASITGGVIGARWGRRLGDKKTLMVCLFLECVVFIGFIWAYLGISSHAQGILIGIFILAVCVLNIKFVALYAVMMQYSFGKNSAMDWSILGGTEAFLAIICPPIGGYLIAFYGFGVFFVCCLGASFLALLVWGFLGLKGKL
ncbi:hypothetical protein BKH46_00370 [Helicobacter sp. 12S02634-8]|uniref:MFS transporter n=1 Tax=Helicobacter sp. 12S02634-8 TaxID=1476199 RepID=UPI000BA52719|nr:MFS transporter [Helicobacter sp. 12S02634-8]PAF48403.1 hypothetical protein BKH46_00370 [Helicobacter sp. 12S02634-8]